MDRDLEALPEPSDEDDLAFDRDAPMVRPAWWRWLAVVVVIALVVGTPFAYALSRLLH